MGRYVAYLERKRQSQDLASAAIGNFEFRERHFCSNSPGRARAAIRGTSDIGWRRHCETTVASHAPQGMGFGWCPTFGAGKIWGPDSQRARCCLSGRSILRADVTMPLGLVRW